MANTVVGNDSVRASRAGHTFHERWAARRALQLVFPNDDLFAIAVESISPTETAGPGIGGEEVADLVLYYGNGDNLNDCDRLETVQFKYVVRSSEVTASFLRKTIEKFAETIVGYEKSGASAADVDSKVSFVFVTNTAFNDHLWQAIAALVQGTTPKDRGAKTQAKNLAKWCEEKGLHNAARLFSRTVFKAGEKGLAAQDNALKRTLTDWSAGSDAESKRRLYELQDLIVRKAGPSGQGKNLIRREDVLDALDCYPEDLFPAETRFIEVGSVIERKEIASARDLIKQHLPVFVHAEGGVGKTVFIQSLAAKLSDEYEVVVFDCFGGGSYRSDSQSRHLPRIGLVQIVNELASRTLCDPLLPGSDDRRRIIKAVLRRFKQAALAIRSQSKKQGLLIIVDAADNAQLEAEHRHEDAFPKFLLSALDEEPVEGVHLLLTARTHRRAGVIARAKVNELELGPFTETEARAFLKTQKPQASALEITTALARSGRNARVLDYLVSTWDTNVAGKFSTAPITVPEIIEQQCDNAIDDLRTMGWPDNEVTDFFVALSLLPPPIPLEELAGALGWSASQVNTAASDLTPMLEITPHGAIFRDEPTETYIYETYVGAFEAQRRIADRLNIAQSISMYAAEALPHFLVVIKDSERAFALADSTNFPATVQSDFGRRRLTLERLHAAFRLAVAEEDFGKVLLLSMRLAQVATANMRGDEFIRRAPELAVILGDADSYRRLFADRAGWRGARSARLTIAQRFAGEREEAQIECESTVRWINWLVNQPREDQNRERRDGPDIDDYAAILFHDALEGDLERVDRNLARWNDSFSLSVAAVLLRLLDLYDTINGTNGATSLADFAASDKCTSGALAIKVMSHARGLTRKQTRGLAKRVLDTRFGKQDEDDHFSSETEQGIGGDVARASLTALFGMSRASAAGIARKMQVRRPSVYDYGERWGHSRAWIPICGACIRAWSAGKPLTYADLLPSEVKLTKKAKAITNKKELNSFLAEFSEPARPKSATKPNKNKKEKEKLNAKEREDITGGIELALSLTHPIEDALLSGKALEATHVDTFLTVWEKNLSGIHWKHERAVDLLARTAGLGCLHILLDHCAAITSDQAKTIVRLMSSARFYVEQKIDVLAHLARRKGLEEVTGEFAVQIAEQSRQDDNISQRGELYAKLAAALIRLSVEEARDYYRQGLSQLDQIGGESYDQIYSLLHFAATQRGGHLEPSLAQRLMNLCQTIISNEPSKFGWTLFARAAAKSIGYPAIAKLLRWDDQDVADSSYGLPQLVSFMAENNQMDPRRAAFFLTISKDHEWWDWRSGDAVEVLLRLSAPNDQRAILRSVIGKMRADHPHGAWPTLWEGYLATAKKFPNLISAEEMEKIDELREEAQREQDQFNARNSSSPDLLGRIDDRPTEAEVETKIREWVAGCDPRSAGSIDQALKAITAAEGVPYDTWLRFIDGMRTSCPYNARLACLFAICEATELTLSQSQDILTKSVAVWRDSTAHVVANLKAVTEKLIATKGIELFEGQFSNVARGIKEASDFCGDRQFVLQLVLQKIVAGEVELDGNEWLQIATSLCDLAPAESGLQALSLLLAGPASRIADEIGEGGFRPELAIKDGEPDFIADAIWHLLGDEDAYIRWNVARGLSTLVDLGLTDDLDRLLTRFDVREIPFLGSSGRSLSFQNSQQWLLMGLARAAAKHGPILNHLRPALLRIVMRNDVHAPNKVHIVRALINLEGAAKPNPDLRSLRNEIETAPYGIVTSDKRPPASEAAAGFSFDYDFTKTEISTAVRLFNLPQAAIEDAMGREIIRLWPAATSMDFFGGPARYQWDRTDRFENFREHVQRHALLSAVTTLSQTVPVIVRSYETDERSPWLTWLDRYDITFDDGLWLSDKKNDVPPQAKASFLGKRVGAVETLQDQTSVLKKLGIAMDRGAPIPLYGRWSSPDGVDVSISSALSEKKGAIGRCRQFARATSGDFWLPEFWDDGYYDRHYRSESPFEPLVWSPETHSLGIDAGDRIAAKSAAGRPRLGIELTKQLAISEKEPGRWYSANHGIVLTSQVWGSWHPDPDQRKGQIHDDGEVLWANPKWLDGILPALGRQLVFTVTLWKYPSSRSYDETSGVKAVYVCLRKSDGETQIWQAKKAAKSEYY